MRRAVWVLGVIAVLSVVASATLAVTVSSSRTESRQWLRRYGLEVAVPARRWQREAAHQAIRYADEHGDTRAQVAAPAVLDVGFCPSSRSSSRAFVGLLPPEGGSVRRVLTRELGTWASAIWAAAIPLPAVTGTRSRVDVDVPVAPGPCAPTTAHLTLVGRPTAAGVVVLVLVRDVGEPDDLTTAEAEAIVGSLRAIGS